MTPIHVYEQNIMGIELNQAYIQSDCYTLSAYDGLLHKGKKITSFACRAEPRLSPKIFSMKIHNHALDHLQEEFPAKIGYSMIA